MAMVQNYIKSSLKIVVAQICHNMGWHAIQTTPLELLVDILHRYLEELGKTAHRYSEQFGRTEPNLDDLGLAFKDIGVLLVELEDFVNNVEPVPFVQDMPKIPVARPNHLQYPKQGSREVLTRPEWIDEHLPLMNPEVEDEIESPSTSVDFNRKNGAPSAEMTDGLAQGLRRPLEAIGTNGVPFKRPRLFADDEGCPMRDGSSVSMTLTGDIALDGRQANARASKFLDEIRCSSSSHSPEQSAVDDAWKDGKKELKKTDKVKLKNKKDKGKIVKKKNGKKEKVKNSSKKNKDKNKEGKKLKLMTDAIMNTVGRGPDGKFKKMKMKIPKSKPLIIKTKKAVKTGVEKSNKNKKKLQTLGVSPSFLSTSKLPKTPKVKLSTPKPPKPPKPPKTEKHPSPLAQLATFLSKAGTREQQLGENSPLDLGVSIKSEISQGFSGEDSPERLIIDDNPLVTESKERESRLAAVNDSINSVIMRGLEETAKNREESSRSYHETIEDVIRQSVVVVETPVKTEPRDVYDFTDDEMSPPATPATPEGLTSPPKKKQRVEPAEMNKKVRDKIKEKIKSKEAKPKVKQSFAKFKTEEMDEPHDYSTGSDMAPHTATPEPDNGVSFQAPYPQMLHLPYFSHIPKVPPALLPYPSSIPPMPLPFQSHIPPNMPMPPMGFYVRNPRPETATGNFRFNEPVASPMISSPQPTQPAFPMDFKKLDVFVQPKVEMVDEIDKGKGSVAKKEKSEEGETEKLKSKKKKEKGKEKKKGTDGGGTEKSQSKSGKGSKEKAPKSKDKSKKTEKKKKEEKVRAIMSKDDSASTIPRITLKLGGNAAQSEGTKIVLKLKLPKPIPTSPFAASLPAPVFQQASSSAKCSSSATAHAQTATATATACEPFAEHESDSSNSSIQPSLNPNYDTDSSIPSSECGSVTSYSVPSSPVVVVPPELPPSDAVKASASAVTDEEVPVPVHESGICAQEKNEWNSTLNACSLPASLSSFPVPVPLPVPLPNDDSRNVCRVIKPLAPREIVQSSDSSSPTTDILSATPKSHPKPQFKVNPVPLPAKSVSVSVSASASHSAPARTVITETIGTIIDDQGNKIWICPACTRPDDGSPMIGCDECDDWYHWVCVGIVVPPKEEENWFCSRCIVKKQGLQKKKKKKHRKDKIDL